MRRRRGWEDTYEDEYNPYYDCEEEEDADSEDEEEPEEEETLTEVAGSLFVMLAGLGIKAAGEGIREVAKVSAERKREENRIEAEKERARQKRIQRRKNRREDFWEKHWKTVVISVLVLGLALFAAYRVSEYRKLTSVGYAADALQGQPYESVVSCLKDSGFTKISVEERRDLSIENEGMSGSVSEVMIDGKSRFDASEKFPYDVKITVFYHSLKLVSPPFSHKDIKGTYYKDAYKQLEAAGFLNITEVPLADVVLGWISEEGEIKTISISGKTEFYEVDSFRPDAEVVITYHSSRKG